MLAKENTCEDLVVSFTCDGEEQRLPPQDELALYRMAQEGLTNVVKHARARQASLELAYLPDSVQVRIADDGVGFTIPENPGEFARLGHFGLLGLHERAELIGAGLELDSNPGRGTRLVISLPRPAA